MKRKCTRFNKPNSITSCYIYESTRTHFDLNYFKNYLKFQVHILFEGLMITNFAQKHLISMIQGAQILHGTSSSN